MQYPKKPIRFTAILKKMPTSESELGSMLINYSLEEAVNFVQETQIRFPKTFLKEEYSLAEIAWLWCYATGKYELAYFIDTGDDYEQTAVFASSGLLYLPDYGFE